MSNIQHHLEGWWQWIFHRIKMQQGFLNTQRLQPLTCFILWPSQPMTWGIVRSLTLIRSCEACLSKSSGLIQSFIQSWKEKQWQHISGPCSLRERYLIGGPEGGFWPLQAVQIRQETVGKELCSEGTKKKILNVYTYTYIKEASKYYTSAEWWCEKSK